MGILFMFLASASFATMSALVKGISTDIPLQQLVFLRCIIALPIIYVFLKIKKRPLIVRARKLILLRTALGLSAMYCFFYALTHMPLAECVFIGRTQPLLLALLAPYVVGESAPGTAWIAIIAGLAGVAFIMKPSLAWSSAAWVALCASALAAGAHLLVRRLNRTDFPLVIVFNFTLLTTIFTAFWALPLFKSMTGVQWIMGIGIAVFASTGQILMTLAYRIDKAPVVAAASYSSVILSIVYGYLFWAELPETSTWIGGILIIFGGLILASSRLRTDSSSA